MVAGKHERSRAMTAMPSILITGSNRGLGLEWARQHAAEGWRVHATCRHPGQADALQALARSTPSVSIHRLDVTRSDEIAQLVDELSGAPIDLLINNAGVYLEKFDNEPLGRISYGHWEETLAVNTLGAVRLTEALKDNLGTSRRRLVVTITSHMGCIAEITAPGSYAYRSSKAALNAAMKGLSIELAPRGIGVVLLHPGWVKTRMGGPGARISTTESVQGMRAIIDRFQMPETGRLYRYDGRELPW
jgi:NAD(P)-dependent dehydrogenase (short-subunit alcohol dehydrogenase family)